MAHKGMVVNLHPCGNLVYSVRAAEQLIQPDASMAIFSALVYSSGVEWPRPARVGSGVRRPLFVRSQ
jgi:hypothetical protein